MATLESSDIMEYIWNNVEKAEDGLHIYYTRADIDSLWEMGFVDTANVSIDHWRAAFDEHRQSDGTYRLTKDDFFAKDRYRYKGTIHIPFDAMMINEGLYTDEGLNELVTMSIAPSCSLSSAELGLFVDAIKQGSREADRLIRMDRSVKLKIQEMINQHPSPMRRLEILFARNLEHLKQTGNWPNMEDMATPASPSATASPQQVAETYRSAFSSLPSQHEHGLNQLKGLEKAKTAPSGADKHGTPLKALTRSPKGTRG